MQFSLLIKPTGSDCNLACPQCFYLPKADMYARGPHRMSEEMLEHIIRGYMSLRMPGSSFLWQGGEPMLMGLDFYKRAIGFQEKYGAPGQVVSNSLQTNGLLLDDAWCKFMKQYKWRVGISLDGPRELHDRYRRDSAGAGSFEKVMAGIEACRRNNVEFNILTLITNGNCHAADELFDFYLRERFDFIQFIPCSQEGYAPKPEELGRFLCRLFDRWFTGENDWMHIWLFDSLIAYALQKECWICTFGYSCDDYLVVEHNGDVYPCDFFVEEGWRLGNIMETPIEKLAACEKRSDFASRKRRKSNKCIVCRWNAVCNGGCPKDRLVAGGWSEASCFCGAYRMFFEHAMPGLNMVAATLE